MIFSQVLYIYIFEEKGFEDDVETFYEGVVKEYSLENVTAGSDT